MDKKGIFTAILLVLLLTGVYAQFYDPNYYNTQNYNDNYYAGYNTGTYNRYGSTIGSYSGSYQNNYNTGSGYNAYSNYGGSQYPNTGGSYQSNYNTGGYNSYQNNNYYSGSSTNPNNYNSYNNPTQNQYNYNTYGGNAYSGSNGYLSGSNYYQSTYPNSGFSGFSQTSTFWPQLSGAGAGNSPVCNGATSDFLIAIPPGACTPNVVRSDLLAEQNVPVFCKLSTLKLNPLIDASAIQSISFSGDYPEGVTGISYQPARQAIRNYNTILSGPATDDAGYVVITLARQADERNLPQFIEGNLTARIRYDSRQLTGTSHAEYYLDADDGKTPFWQGKGFVEVESVDRGVARINIYTDLNSAPYQSFTLAQGQSSPIINLPGYYCTAGVRLQMNQVVSPDDMALLNVEGDQIWVREGSRFFNNLCQVNTINVLDGGTGSVSVTCAGQRFNLELQGRGVTINSPNGPRDYNIGEPISYGAGNYYLAHYGKGPNRETFIVLSNEQLDQLDIAFINNHYNSRDWTNVGISDFENSLGETSEGQRRIGTYGSGYFILYPETQNAPASILNGVSFSEVGGNIQDNDKYNVGAEIEAGNNLVRELAEFYPTEEKLEGTYWGEEALYEQIVLTGKTGHHRTQLELIELFEQSYPGSDFLTNVLDMKRTRNLYDSTNAHASVRLNNEHFNIFVESFRKEQDFDKSATIRIGGQSAEFVREGDEIPFSSGKVIVERIDVNGVFFNYVGDDGSTQGRPIALNSFGQIGGREIEVRDIESRQVAHISLVPQVNNNQNSQASFSFKIGVEERNIKLNPDKTEDAIKNLNQTIVAWEEVLERLGNVIKVWKAVCFATSTILMLETMLDGFNGESIARSKVMDQYKTICDIEISRGKYSSRTECYNDLSQNVDNDVNKMQQAINDVNAQLKQSQQGNVQSQGLLGQQSIINQSQYVNDLKQNLQWNGVEVNGVKVETQDLTKSTEVSSILLYQNLQCNVNEDICAQNNIDDVACCSAYKEMIGSLGSTAIQKQAKVQGQQVQQNIQQITGGTQPQVQVVNTQGTKTLNWNGQTGKDVTSNRPSEISPEDKIQFLNLNSRTYLLKLQDATLGGSMGIKNAYVLQGTSWQEVTDLTQDDLGKLVFIGGSRNACENNIIKNPEVRYYESGRNQGLPAVVPFDVQNGWYAYVPNSQGSILQGSLQTYSAAGDVNFFWICNAGDNGLVEYRSGDDLCQSFSANQVGFDTFISCGMQGPQVSQIYARARDAIRQAAQNYGQGGFINVNGQSIQTGAPLSDTGGAECQDFMSPEDCKLLFNACDPVICPSSRCDLGGKYPVADVVQTGIVGSVALCLPNLREGVIFPVCLTGIHAGLDAFVSILRSEQECLQHNLETGQYVGICDEITAIYMCEFFWRQFGSILDILLPSFFEAALGQPQVRGGGEYLNIQSAFNNLQQSTEYFTGFYAQNAATSFNLRSSQNIGAEVCNGFLGTSVPLGLSAEGFDALLAPQSPPQFYAYFSEVPFTDATSPATSHYKVYYHIYAGNNFGANYQVYLKSPAISSGFNTPFANVKSGFVTRGDSADEAIDFTGPAGFKELCVRINNQEHCGFGTVSSSFAVNYATEQYAADQALQQDITTESECVSTSASAWGLVSPNLQSGVETAIGGRDINLAGITRVCANQNPEIGIASPQNQVVCSSNTECGSGYICEKTSGSEVGNCIDQRGERQVSAGRWIDVGYCGDPNLRCWLDSSTLKDRFNAINAVNQEIYGQDVTVEQALRYGDLFSGLQQSYELARSTLSEQYNKIRTLTPENLRGGTSDGTISEIIADLDEIIGDFSAGYGTANNKAEALALKATIYRMIIEQKLRDTNDVFGTGAVPPQKTTQPTIVQPQPSTNFDSTPDPVTTSYGTTFIGGQEYITQGSSVSTVYFNDNRGRLLLVQGVEFVGSVEDGIIKINQQGLDNQFIGNQKLSVLDGVPYSSETGF